MSDHKTPSPTESLRRTERQVLILIHFLGYAVLGLAFATEPASERSVLVATLGVLALSSALLAFRRSYQLSKVVFVFGAAIAAHGRLAAGLYGAVQEPMALSSVPPIGPYVIFVSALALILFRGRLGLLIALALFAVSCVTVGLFFATFEQPIPVRFKLELLGHYVGTHALFITLLYLFGHFRVRIGRYESELKSLSALANTDPLTGLANRRTGMEVLERVTKRNRVSAQVASVIMIDLDHFKRINDTAGHDAGDRVLCATSEALAAGVRPQDTVCRWGGEEFLIVVFGAGYEASCALAERLRRAVSEIEVEDVAEVSASLGVAMVRENDDASSVVARADKALYRSKRSGRNRVSAELDAVVA